MFVCLVDILCENFCSAIFLFDNRAQAKENIGGQAGTQNWNENSLIMNKTNILDLMVVNGHKLNNKSNQGFALNDIPHKSQDCLIKLS